MLHLPPRFARPEGVHPPLDFPDYRTTGGEAAGQRITVHGRVLDSDGKPIPHTLVEVWQANAAGRYRHVNDSWPAPLDPYFNGVGRCVTDENGEYRFTTIKPGAYPWRNHHNAWRPAHIHFSLFGTAFTQRLVTQMYFPDDPLFFQDPIYNAVPADARQRVRLRHHRRQLGTRVPLRHRVARPGSHPPSRMRKPTTMSDFAPRYAVTPGDQATATFGPTPSQTVGPYWKIGLDWGTDGENVVPADTPGRITVRVTVLDGNRKPVADAMIETWQCDTDGRYGAPHLLVGIFARGMLDRLYTRLYFPEDLAAHATDPVLTALPESQRVKLVADKSDDGYEWTVYVQDLDPNGVETPFFSI